MTNRDFPGKILVTGGTGFIGCHTSVELLNAGYRIVILDNFSNSKPAVLNRISHLTNKDFSFYQCDVTNRNELDKLFAEQDIAAVIHFAGLKAVGESVYMPLEYYENNLGGTVTLCEAMRAANCKNLVFSSSATVYGMNNPSPLKEEYATSSTNPYGSTKMMIEWLLRDVAAADPEWSISMLRYFNPIGAHKSGLIGEDPNGVPNNLLPYVALVAAGRLDKLTVFGDDYTTPDGTGVRDYIHVVDLALGHIAALEYVLTHKGVEAVNLGTGKGTSVLDIVNAYRDVSGKPIPYKISGRRPGDIATCYADIQKAKRLLGWEAKRNIGEMCEDSWRFAKQHYFIDD